MCTVSWKNRDKTKKKTKKNEVIIKNKIRHNVEDQKKNLKYMKRTEITNTKKIEKKKLIKENW